MADIAPSGLRPRDQRKAAIEQLFFDVRATLAAGKSVNEHSIIAAHPELMPELQQAFDALWSQIGKASIDDTPATQTRVRPGDSTAPGDSTLPDKTIARPGRSGTPTVSGSASAPAGDDSRVGAAGGFAGARSSGRKSQELQIPGYSVQRELSRGGQAVVFVAIQLSTGRKVALKVMHEGPFADERSLARFQREVQILAALDHPNIVSIIDTGKTADGSQFIAMPYITGGTLSDYMHRRQQKDPADPSKLLRMFYKICVAVNEAHLRGIVHRDLKPSNIRVDERGEPHVLDFGLARTALDRFIKGSNEPVSITGEFMGSLPWSSPEQAEGDPEKIDMRTDVYSLGVILYQMLTGGRFPYEVVGNIRDVLNNIVTREPMPPSQLVAGMEAQTAAADRSPPAHPLPMVNEVMERIVLKSLSKRKELRYQNAGELGKDVSRYLLGKQVKKDSAPTETGVQPGQPEQMVGTPAPRTRLYAAIIAGVAVVVGFAALAWHLWGGTGTVAKNALTTGGTEESQRVKSTGQSPDAGSPLRPPGQQSVDLLASVDLSRDTRSGAWTKSGATLVTDSAANCQVVFPYAIPQEYDYSVGFECTAPGTSVGVLLTGGGRQFFCGVGNGTGNLANTLTGFSLVDNGGIGNNRTTRRRAEWVKIGQHQKLLLKVRKNRTEAYLDGELVASIDTDYRDVRLPGFLLDMRPDDSLGISVGGGHFIIESATLSPAEGQAVPTVEAVPGQPAAPPPDQPSVDLLKLVDLKKDIVSGTWSMANGLLQSGREPNARIQFPYVPPAEYDFKLVFARTQGNADLSALLTKDARPFEFMLGGWVNTIAGFGNLNNRGADSNRTTQKRNRWLANDQRYTMVLKVRKDGVTTFLDGAQIDSIHTDYHDLTLRNGIGLPRQDTLGINTWESAYTFYQAEVQEVTGSGQVLGPGPSPQTAPAAPLQVIRPANNGPNGQFAYGINGGTVTAYINGKPLPAANGFNLQVQSVRLIPGDHIVLRATGNGQGWKAIGFDFNGTGETPSFCSTAGASTVRILPNPPPAPIPAMPVGGLHPRVSARLPGRVIESAGNFKLDDHIEWLLLDGPGVSEYFFTVPGPAAAAGAAREPPPPVPPGAPIANLPKSTDPSTQPDAGEGIAFPSYIQPGANSLVAHEQHLLKARLGKGNIDVYFEGDTIFRRWGCSDPSFAGDYANWKANFWGWNAADFAWGADAVPNILWRLQNGEMDGVNPKVVVFLGGTSDLTGGAKAADLMTGLAACFDTIHKKAPDATLIIVGILPRLPAADMSIIDQVNESLSKLADGKKTRFVNVNDKLIDKDGGLAPGMFNSDNVHPTVMGYQAIADAIKPILTERLGPPAKVDHAPPPSGDPTVVPDYPPKTSGG